MKRLIGLLAFLLANFFVFAQNPELDRLNNLISKTERNRIEILKESELLDSNYKSLVLQQMVAEILHVGLASSSYKEPIVTHSGMVLQYAEMHEQARWVMHIISPLVKEGTEGRTNNFRPDPKVSTGTTVEQDFFLKKEVNGKTEYDGFGYDRGHLAPSADFRWSATAISESYYYSNMSPQLPGFNREGWADLESMLRGYVIRKNQRVFVITGPVLEEGLPVIERSVNKVSIPKQFFKVLLDLENKTAIGFLVPHTGQLADMSEYAVSIDKVEEVTGLDFFPNLDDDLEQKLESQNQFQTLFPEESGNATPIPPNELSSGQVNTHSARYHIGNKTTVCGTVVSAYQSKKGHVFLNLDKQFPNQVFSVTIWESNVTNFSYSPHQYLLNKKVCITGRITENEGTPTMNAEKGKQLKVID